MNLRWPLVASLVALFGGIGVAALVLALCGEGAGGPAGDGTGARPTRTPLARILTPLATPTPLGDAGRPTETPPAVTPSTTPTPLPTTTPTPGLPADLVVLDLGVFNDQIVVVVRNQGEGAVVAGYQVDISVRGIVADSIVLGEPLLPGDDLTAVLAEQVIYRPEVVLAQVDPNNVVPESNENNNSLTVPLQPDITPDMAVTGLAAVGAERHLAVDLSNTTGAPVRQARVTLRALRCDSAAVLSTMEITVDLDPQGSTRVTIVPEVIVAPAVCMRVTMEVADVPDARADNNAFQATIP